MALNQRSAKPTTPRCSPGKKSAAVHLERNMRTEFGTEHGTVQRVALQLGYGIDSTRLWLKQANIDRGHVAGLSTAEGHAPRPLAERGRPRDGTI